MNESEMLTMFAEVTHAALCEAGHPDLIFPAFLNGDGLPYLEFDTDDHEEGSREYAVLLRAEELGQMAVTTPRAAETWKPTPAATPANPQQGNEG